MLPFLVHLGYAIMLCGFVARDILALRGLLLAGQLVLAAYAFGIGVPAITGWNVLFAAINTVWVVLILRERREVRVPRELQTIHRAHFAAMTPREFLAWWSLGRKDAVQGVPLTRDGVQPAALYFILNGAVLVRRGESTIAELARGFFVGEMSLITGRPANADVDPVGRVEVQRWSRSDLDDLRARDLGMWTKVQSAIGADLVEKIQRQTLVG